LNIKGKNISPQRTQSYAERVKSEFECLAAGLLYVVCHVCLTFMFPQRFQMQAYRAPGSPVLAFAVKIVGFDRIRDRKEGYNYG